MDIQDQVTQGIDDKEKTPTREENVTYEWMATMLENRCTLIATLIPEAGVRNGTTTRDDVKCRTPLEKRGEIIYADLSSNKENLTGGEKFLYVKGTKAAFCSQLPRTSIDTWSITTHGKHYSIMIDPTRDRKGKLNGEQFQIELSYLSHQESLQEEKAQREMHCNKTVPGDIVLPTVPLAIVAILEQSIHYLKKGMLAQSDPLQPSGIFLIPELHTLQRFLAGNHSIKPSEEAQPLPIIIRYTEDLPKDHP